MNRNLGDGDKSPLATGANEPLGVNSEIGRKLKQYYDDIVSEDVPDRFAALLSQLEATENSRKKD